ncbi:hypothetical protein [Corynebacterium sphenisci]|uniref:hypothetical protein n=1 Tax=Corynebacterium sphenisci TaxID=191493 RepID=UPI0026E0B332|nr:hypothetical protein [Corynebacterium sphenisci]MDO5730796.1 hypothetical protein [Corynebacterium sphenisci]
MEEYNTPFDQLDDDRFRDLLRKVADHCETGATKIISEIGEAPAGNAAPEFGDGCDIILLAGYFDSMADGARAIADIWQADPLSYRAIAAVARSLIETAGAVVWILDAGTSERRLYRAQLFYNESLGQHEKMAYDEEQREKLGQVRASLEEVRKEMGLSEEFPRNTRFVNSLYSGEKNGKAYALLCANTHPDGGATIAYFSNKRFNKATGALRTRQFCALVVSALLDVLEKLTSTFDGPEYDTLERDRHLLLVETFGKRG